MEQCTLVIKDHVNVKFEGLDPFVRRKINEALKFFVPYARHMPSFKMGRWDGKIGFATVGGATYLNLLDRVLPIVLENGYDITLDDRREERLFEFPEITEKMFSHKVWPEGHVLAGEPIELRDYQAEAIRTYVANLASIQSISTGAGKTLLTASLSYLCEPHGRTIVIVPSKSLVEQTEEDYRNLGLDVGVFYGDRKEWGHTHTISTWQSLSVFAKKVRNKKGKVIELDFDVSLETVDPDSGTRLEDFLKGIVCVMVDEVHSAKAKELKDLLTGPMANIPIRWGLTGTIPKEDFEYLSIVASLGPVVGEIRASDLQEQDVLAKCNIEILQLVDDIEYNDYHTEYDYLVNNPERLAFIGKTCRAIAETGNTLILVDRLETGEILAEAIPNSVFISGKVKTKNRSKEYKEVQLSENKVIIATYGVAAVGINIPRIFNLVLVEAGKSFVRVIQSIGRGLRKAHDKDEVAIYDVTSTAKFSKRHLAKRKAFYKEAGYPSQVKKVTYRA